MKNHIITEKLPLFLALSRSQHGILDVAMPACCALLWLGHFPSIFIIIIGLVTAFAGYTAVYALNDIIGFKSDRTKMQDSTNHQGYSVESSDLRHPIAQGLLSLPAAIGWASFWFTIAIIGSYILNPVIVLILIAGGLLEAAYCSMVKVTYLRTLVSGLVKSCGPVSAVFAVTATPSWQFLLTLLFWVFLWELGGQNIPADWTDIEEDRRIGARTLPIQFGEKVASRVIFVISLCVSIVSVILVSTSSLKYEVIWAMLLSIAAITCLVLPALQLLQNPKPSSAARLFDKASYYPLACLVTLALACAVQ